MAEDELYPYLVIRGAPSQLQTFVERLLVRVAESNEWCRDLMAEDERADADSDPAWCYPEWGFVVAPAEGRRQAQLWLIQHHSGEYLSVSTITSDPMVPGPGLPLDERRRVLEAFEELVRPIAVALNVTLEREPKDAC